MLLLLFKHFHNKLARIIFFLAGVLRRETYIEGNSMQLFVWLKDTEQTALCICLWKSSVTQHINISKRRLISRAQKMVYLKVTCTDCLWVLESLVTEWQPSFPFIAVCGIPIALKSSNTSLFSLILKEIIALAMLWYRKETHPCILVQQCISVDLRAPEQQDETSGLS